MGLLQLCVLFAVASVSDSTCCPNDCTLNGDCHGADCACVCKQGYGGADCSRRLCPTGKAWVDHAKANDDAHNQLECSNMGLCDRTIGVCTCDIGFTGLSCNRKKCPNDCSGHGHCQSIDYYASRKDPGEGTVHSYKGIWDSDMMYGCMCDPPYFGPDCLSRECPRGDDPLTGSIDDQNGEQVDEKQVVNCRATNGKFTLSFRGEATAYIAYNEALASMSYKMNALSTITAADVRYSGATKTACTPQGNAITIYFRQQHGDVPMLVPNSDHLIHSSAIQDPELTVTEIVRGNKEDNFCSDRGACDVLTGYCLCGVGYDTSDGIGGQGTPTHNRGDCGFATVSITTCPGEIACSGHGVCRGTPTYRCLCSKGWQAFDCSERTCPSEVSWFDIPISNGRAHQRAECSDMGTCERSKGECVCNAGFQGHACERLNCPGLPACSGHGKCLTISHLAELTEDNGDVTDITYGMSPNKPSTWDFEKIQGCKCDLGYEGYDCSLRSCPVGDDPRTTWHTSRVKGKTMEAEEIQAIKCVATTFTGNANEGDDSFFRLSFRCGKYNNIQSETINPACTTDRIRWDASEADVKKALEKLKTIGGGQHQHQNFDSGKVEVHFSKKYYMEKKEHLGKINRGGYTAKDIADANKACTAAGDSTIVIQFKSEYGDLPALQVSDVTNPMLTLEVETDGKGEWSQRGSKERKECSGRGLCDYGTGQCTCAAGYGSSNGFNKIGSRRDCGRVIEVVDVASRGAAF